MKGFLIALSALLFTACSVQARPIGKDKQLAVSDRPTCNSKPTLKPSSNEMLRAPLTSTDGLEVIVSDVVIPPHATVPRHYHPGEEFIYIIEGSVVHIAEGEPKEIRRAGDAFVLGPGVIHAPRGTEEGMRAIVFRVHPEGEPERIPVDEQLADAP